MVSLTYLLTVISSLACLVLADDVGGPKPDSSDEKWFFGGGYRRWLGAGAFGSGLWGWNAYPWLANYGGGFAGCGVLPYYGTWFSKDINTSPNTRRSNIVDAEQLFRRDEASVACKSHDGKSVQLNSQDCEKAANLLTSKKTSQQSCGSCMVKLVSPDGPVSATGVPADALAKVTDKILKSCAADPGQGSQPTRRSPADTSGADKGQKLVVLVQKGNGEVC